MVSGQENDNGSTQFCARAIVAFVSISYNLIIHQLDITSRHFAAAFNIPIYNVGIYFDKLYSIRCLLIVIGSALEYVIFQVAGGDLKKDEYCHMGDRIRKYVGMVSFGAVLIVRVVFLVLLYNSSKPAYDVYVILTAEAFFYGLHDGAIMGLASAYIPFISLFYNICRIVILVFQFFLDLLWFERPLLMIQIQIWINLVFTTIGVALWVYYNLCIKPIVDKENSTKAKEALNGSKDSIDGAVTPFIMFFTGSMCKDFLTPGTLPYALLQRDRCHLINKISSIIFLIGPLTFVALENADILQKWEPYCNAFLLATIPMAVIFIYSFLAMHTRIPSARRIINSRPRVMTMTLVLVFCYGFIEPLNFIGVAKYATRGNPNGYTIQGINNTFAILSRSFFARLSVGYSDTRISLGYHLPKFRPNHRMSKKNLAWYFIRQTFKRSWDDMKRDLKFDIHRYL
ncbi:hypothetical protein MACJ_001576 [Theileria orientalis]|uniref:Uncharacterized protein n=1 Tax=Theileria orientalis TaxID=68886 RepID=A0A976M8M3_THEOR|nr:hypothetical protein MACJ_001576 [Theileria orientalis]